MTLPLGNGRSLWRLSLYIILNRKRLLPARYLGTHILLLSISELTYEDSVTRTRNRQKRKAKVVAAVWETEFIQFHVAPQVYHQVEEKDEYKNGAFDASQNE